MSLINHDLINALVHPCAALSHRSMIQASVRRDVASSSDVPSFSFSFSFLE